MKDVTCAEDVGLDQVPEDEARYVGVEIEFCHPLSEEALAARIVGQSWAPYVTLKSDSSVVGRECPKCVGYYSACPGCGRDDSGLEFAILLPEDEYASVLPCILTWLKSVGAYVNKTCGVHVHLDMRNRDPKTAFQRLASAERLLYRLCAARRAVSTYCSPLESMSFEHYPSDKYHGINVLSLDKYNTIEVRMHEGSLNPERLVSWVALLIHLVDTPVKVKCRNFRRALKSAELPPELEEYVRRAWVRNRAAHKKLHYNPFAA